MTLPTLALFAALTCCTMLICLTVRAWAKPIVFRCSECPRRYDAGTFPESCVCDSGYCDCGYPLEQVDDEPSTAITGLLMACLTVGTIAGLTAWRMM
jgi:hypothetical protein